jgi:hypothetical protein
MGLQMSHLVKVSWIKEGNATDAMGSTWVKVFDFEDLPDLVTVPIDVKASAVKSYIEGRYGYQVGNWSYWSAIAEARSMADNLYSGDPV